ncbi:right-handed parallel beta-helix repeat-containing protein [Archangium violaceum]|uniref:LamG-like jellyroll fold domain-containing protein n=1 Tax=Archangium violaceum TaxID=83451 RepID=UPI001951C88E|nr:LamG-like jellyroll fold domain-containing protein [Archangium violaceum]QRN98501.1 right-handed parallel beta-helix repeat-containing protein [Archangium violaceum]
MSRLVAALLSLGLAIGCGVVGEERAAENSTESQRSAIVTIPGLPAPVAVWSFDDCSYTSDLIADSTGKTGVWSGKVGCAFRSPSGAAGRFTGQGKVETADRPNLHFTTAMTLSALVKPARVDGSQAIVNKWYFYDSYALAIRNGRYQFDIALPGGTWGVTYNLSAPATAGQWAHLAGTFDGQTMRLYVNGQRVAQASVTGSLQDSNRPIAIGDHPSGNAYHGLIDDVRLFNVALDGTQVKRLASALLGIPQATALWDFDDCSDTSTLLRDTSGNASPADGQKSGAATCATGLSGSAISFAGGVVDVADKPQLHFTTSLTLAAVVKPSRVDVSQVIVNKWYAYDSYSLSVSGGQYHFTIVLPGGTWGQPHDIAAPATAGQWAHVAGTYDGQTMRLYVNGQRVAQASVSGTLQNSNKSVEIGNYPAGNAFQGFIDDVRLFNVALSEAQVVNLAYLTSGLQPPCVTPVAGQQLVVGASTRVCAGTYDLPSSSGTPAVRITASGVTLECAPGTVFRSSSGTGTTAAPTVGISVSGVNDVTVRGCGAKGFRYGLTASSAARLLVEDAAFDDNFTDPAAGWVQDSVQGGGVRFDGVTDSTVNASTLSRNWNGFELRSNSRNNQVVGNVASHCSNTGATLVDSHNNVLARNDFSWGIRGDNLVYPSNWYGVDTRDSAGIIVDAGSSGNLLYGNDTRYGGDGIFLRAVIGACAPNNTLQNNDTSFSPHNAIESWCDGNKFIGNIASDSNYGLWLGGNDNAVVSGNTVERNLVDGISIQIGEDRHTVIENNRIAHSGRVGILLTGREIQEWDVLDVCKPRSSLANSSHLLIQRNTFASNGTNTSRCTGNCDVYLEATRGVMLASNCTGGNVMPTPRLGCQVEGVFTVGGCGLNPNNGSPDAQLAPVSAVAGQPVTLDASASSDKNDPLGFHWLVQRAGASFVPDALPPYQLLGAGTATPSVTFPSAGLYDVDVFVNDGTTGGLASRLVAVAPNGTALGDTASQWGFRCNSTCTTTLTDDTVSKLFGSGSVKVASNEGFGLAVFTPAGRNLALNASSRTRLGVFLRARNPNQYGWQGTFPVVVLGTTGGGEYVYTPSANLLPTSPDEWVYVELPLAGGSGWTRTASGSPTFSKVDYVEIRTDTWGADPYDIWVDGLTLF